MHEVIERHMESMTEELEEMRRTALFTPDTIKTIVKTRKEHEYKINGISKHKQDFEKYIGYEKMLLEKIKIRRDKCKIAERKNIIEYKILRRIKNLYEIALQRFSNDFSLYLNYFKFCKESNFINAASIAIENMLKNCSHNSQAWQVAAGWYANVREDLNMALKILNRGLTIHKNSQLLYTEAIKLELSVIKSSGTSTQDDENLKKKVYEKIGTYIKFICECINDCHYLVKILEMIETHSCTTNEQNLIIDKLVQNYSDKEFVWHTIAQRERRGLHHGSDLEHLQKSGETPLTLCFNKYQEGIKKVALAEKESLWSKYLDCLINAQHESNELSSTIKMNLLKNALQQASNDKFLSERYYIIWLEHASDNEALEIFEKGFSVFPTSKELWKLYLHHATMTEKIGRVRDVFNQGVEVLKEQSLPLWFIVLRFYGLLNLEAKMDKIYTRAIKEPPEISQVLKPKYIEWLTISKGISDARKVYNELADQKPWCKELHITMAKVESLEINPDYDLWKLVHERACLQFGEEDVDVWINHVLFYLQFNKCSQSNVFIQRINEEARQKLSTLLHAEFEEKYQKAIASVE